MIVGQIVFLSAALLVGWSYADVSSKQRIIGGENARIEDYPYQVSLRVFNRHFCGGSIISERHILTAAHCVINLMKPPYTLIGVVTGTSFINQRGEAHRIAKVDVHPDWTANEKDSFQYDLAIITLKNKINFNEHQQKVKLPSQNVKDGEKADLTGWGLVRQTPKARPMRLQRIRTTLITNEKCSQKMAKVDDDIVIHKTQVCAFRAPRTGACSGDSGGPLVVDDEIVGVASWVVGTRCALGSPDVYTNVYAFKDFIQSILNRN